MSTTGTYKMTYNVNYSEMKYSDIQSVNDILGDDFSIGFLSYWDEGQKGDYDTEPIPGGHVVTDCWLMLNGHRIDLNGELYTYISEAVHYWLND